MRNDISVKMKIRFLLGRIRHCRARHKEIDSYIEKYIGGEQMFVEQQKIIQRYLTS